MEIPRLFLLTKQEGLTVDTNELRTVLLLLIAF